MSNPTTAFQPQKGSRIKPLSRARTTGIAAGLPVPLKSPLFLSPILQQYTINYLNKNFWFHTYELHRNILILFVDWLTHTTSLAELSPIYKYFLPSWFSHMGVSLAESGY